MLKKIYVQHEEDSFIEIDEMGVFLGADDPPVEDNALRIPKDMS